MTRKWTLESNRFESVALSTNSIKEKILESMKKMEILSSVTSQDGIALGIVIPM